MENVKNAAEAALYIRNTLLQEGWSTEPRSLATRHGDLHTECSTLPGKTRKFVRDGLAICLAELQDANSPWYASNGDQQSRAEELLLFANSGKKGPVNSRNRKEVLELVEVVPNDIDDRIAHENKGVRGRCLQTILGLVSANDRPAREFLESRKDAYPTDVWASMNSDLGYRCGMAGIDMFHGADAVYEWVLKHGSDDDVFALMDLVNFSGNSERWRQIAAEKSANPNLSGKEKEMVEWIIDALDPKHPKSANYSC